MQWLKNKLLKSNDAVLKGPTSETDRNDMIFKLYLSCGPAGRSNGIFFALDNPCVRHLSTVSYINCQMVIHV